MFRTTLALSLALATGLAAAATPPASGNPTPRDRDQWRAQAQARFTAADADRDGTLDRVEAQALAPRLAEHFDRIDADRNGELTVDEMKKARKGRHGGRGAGMAFHAGLLKGMDDDGDGAISRAELGDKMPKWVEDFATIDADSNGKLSREELRGHARQQRGERRHGPRGDGPGDRQG